MTKQELIAKLQSTQEPSGLTQNAVPESPEATNEAAVADIPEPEQSLSTEAETAPETQVPDNSPTESERYHQSRADKLQSLVEKQAEQMQQLLAQTASLQEQLLTRNRQPQVPEQEPDLSTAEGLQQYLKRTTSETLNENLDRSLLDKAKLFFDVQDFRASKPDSVKYDPIYQAAFAHLPFLPKTKAGFEALYNFIEKGLVPLATAAGAKMAEGGAGKNVKPTTQQTQRTIDPTKVAETAKKLSSTNQQGSAIPGDITKQTWEKPGTPHGRRQFARAMLDKLGS